jgi:hypothetical protein
VNGFFSGLAYAFRPLFVVLLKSRISDKKKLDRTVAILADITVGLLFCLILGGAILYHRLSGK